MKRGIFQNRIADETIVRYDKRLERLIMRLPQTQLVELCKQWVQLQFHASTLNREIDDEEGAEEFYWHVPKSVRKHTMLHRIRHRDFPHGLRLDQIAQLEMECLCRDMLAVRWTASQLQAGPNPAVLFSTKALLQTLYEEIDTVFSWHAIERRHPTLPMTLVRLQLLDTRNPQALCRLASKRQVIYLAILESSVHLLHSLLTDASDVGHRLFQQCLIRALQRFHSAYRIQKLSLTAKSLETMYTLLGAHRHAGALGSWRVYADNTVDTTPLDNQPSALATAIALKRKTTAEEIADVRFGNTNDRPLDRFLVALENDCIPDNELNVGDKIHNAPLAFRPKITVQFQGPNVFQGLKELSSQGVLDVQRMPSFMTGEDGRSIIRVVNGNVQ
ncbi:kinetochore protein Mis15 [Schizosaccharomyces japonicus yFS275]|uniref:Kinetochore protein Mis15 n=1 Tax=Schizosaccharomyces japonicus (strain yFS275 / FY16936) TaxID=402676 RepID=B6K7I4_SCHJY|nr:kinetochore protein Mis15 [Schizosaccharomyces japonicus yFS275]EEB09488.1 kinetochore protein Mis15 [Schizosaccharomyces japonicus yFS275]